MDAFEVLQTSLGPALQAIDNGGKNRLIQARLDQERANRRDDLIREEEFRRDERAAEESFRNDERVATEAFTLKHEESQRKTRKEDVEEERVRSLRMKVASLGGKLSGKETEEDLTAKADELDTQHKIKVNAQMKEGELRAKASLLGVPEQGVPTGDLVTAVAEKEKEHEALLERHATEAKVKAAQESPGFEKAKENLGVALVQRQQAMQEASRDIPRLHQALTEDDKITLGKMYASDPELGSILSKLPGGKMLLNGMQKGQPGLYDAAMRGVQTLDADTLERYKLAMVNFGKTTETLLSGHAMEYSGEVQAYLRELSAMPHILQSYDSVIQGMLKNPDFGPALSRESQAELMQTYSGKVANPFTKAEAAGRPSGNPLVRQLTTLPPGGVAAAGSLTPVGQAAPAAALPPMPGTIDAYSQVKALMAAEGKLPPLNSRPITRRWQDAMAGQVGYEPLPRPIGSSVFSLPDKSPGAQMMGELANRPEILELLNAMPQQDIDAIASSILGSAR